MKRLNESRPKHISRFEGKFEDIVFCFSFDTSPHGAAALGAVGSSSGDVDKCHGGVELCESGCGGEGEVVRDAVVLHFGHAGGSDADAEEAGVEASEISLDGGVVEEVAVDEFSQLGVVLTGWVADDGKDLVDLGVEKAFAQNSLADHAGCAEENYVHPFALS